MPGLSSREVDERIRQGLDNEQVSSSTDHQTDHTGKCIYIFQPYLHSSWSVAGHSGVFQGPDIYAHRPGQYGHRHSPGNKGPKQTLDKLKLMKMPKCHVIRDGREKEVAVEDLVLDDVIILGRARYRPTQKVLDGSVRSTSPDNR